MLRGDISVFSLPFASVSQSRDYVDKQAVLRWACLSVSLRQLTELVFRRSFHLISKHKTQVGLPFE